VHGVKTVKEGHWVKEVGSRARQAPYDVLGSKPEPSSSRGLDIKEWRPPLEYCAPAVDSPAELAAPAGADSFSGVSLTEVVVVINVYREIG
jgi:hypothetical protein